MHTIFTCKYTFLDVQGLFSGFPGGTRVSPKNRYKRYPKIAPTTTNIILYGNVEIFKREYVIYIYTFAFDFLA